MKIIATEAHGKPRMHTHGQVLEGVIFPCFSVCFRGYTLGKQLPAVGFVSIVISLKLY
jgi:hypothetical protein